MTERREYQRLHLRRPIDAWFGDFAVRLIDVSASGALVEYDDVIPGESRAILRFFWRGEAIELLAETARHDGKHSGIHFLEDSEKLRGLIAACATELLLAQEGNASGERHLGSDFDETLHAASSGPLASGYVVWTIDEAGWKATAAAAPELPPHGFVVRAAESEEQIELLRRSYESGDAEARRLIRLLAELSVTAPA